MKLDQTDKKILFSLLKNSRMPVQQIAKETHLSREIAQYRMKKLEESGIIKGYVTRINQSFFCQGIASLFLKVSNMTPQKHKDILLFLQNHESINWIGELCGNYDITLSLLYHTPKDLSEKVSSIANFIGKNLIEQQLAIYIAELKFDRSGIIKKAAHHPNAPTVFNNQKRTFDHDDIIILSILSENARAKTVDIAQKTSVDEDAIRLRIKKLQKTQVITGYTIILDPTVLGYESYYLLLSIENLNKELISKIKYYAANAPNVVFCVQTAGKHNVILNILAQDRREFAKLLSELRTAFPEIRNYEINLGMQEHKEVFVPFSKRHS